MLLLLGIRINKIGKWCEYNTKEGDDYVTHSNGESIAGGYMRILC